MKCSVCGVSECEAKPYTDSLGEIESCLACQAILRGAFGPKPVEIGASGLYICLLTVAVVAALVIGGLSSG